MKKISFYVLLIVAFLLPVVALAEVKPDKEFTADEKEVKVYFFRGEGCSHCAEAEAWFKSIEKKYGDKFEVVGYETWNNEDNAALMQQVAEYKGEEVEGVPYILVGYSAWNGFDESYTDNILAEIEELYKQDPKDRYDIMDYVSGVKTEETSESSVLILIILILVVAGVGTGIYFSRRSVNKE